MAKRRWWLPVPLLLLTGLVYLPACDLLHLCGCRPFWVGGDATCDVHRSSGPHCPWCEHWPLGGAALLGIGSGQILFLRARLRAGARPAAAAAASVAVSPVLFVLVGALLWLPTDHPHFIVKDARERLGLPAGPISCVARTGPAGRRSRRSSCFILANAPAQMRTILDLLAPVA